MSTVHDPMNSSISLHGLGFIQVPLGGGQRLHVWHPDLPRRSCFADSAIHDHRFGFTSRVLVGTQINHDFAVSGFVRPDSKRAGLYPGKVYTVYTHGGARLAVGGRPWDPNGEVTLELLNTITVEAGMSYEIEPYRLHSTEPGGDGRVATIITKTEEGAIPARSLCRYGVTPDVGFDRYQLSPDELWMYVREVLSLGYKS